MINRKKALEYWILIQEKIWDIQHGIKSFLYNSCDNIKNVYEWFPIIWKDRHWDYGYFLIIMKKKLELMRDHFNSDMAISEPAKEDAKKMNECIQILDRMIDDLRYGKNCFDEMDEKWGKLNLTFEEKSNINEDIEFGQIFLNREKVKTKEDKEKQREDFKKCLEAEEQERQKDYDDFFNTLKKEVRKWWD